MMTMLLVKMGMVEDWPVVSRNPHVQAHYEQCRREGTSHTLAEMFAFQRPPQSNSDREFLEGTHRQFEKTPHLGDAYKRFAEAHGMDVTGKVYLNALARFPGDPAAWVSGRGDVQRVCERRGWGCDGAVTVRGRELEDAPQDIDVADDLVAEHVQEELARNPDAARMDPQDLKDSVKEKIAPHWTT